VDYSSYFDLGLEHLADAELLLPKSSNPYAMVDRNVELLRDAATVRAIVPLTTLHAMEAVHENVVHDGGQFEAIVTREVADASEANPRHAVLFDEVVAPERLKIFIYNENIPYLVSILDETVHVGVHKGVEPRAIVEADSEDVNEWANGVFGEYKQEAEQIIP
jgi:predicted transcriptional regulator